MEAKCELLGGALGKLPPAEVKAFAGQFDDCDDKACTWELWAAPYIIGGGCSDDAFSDFRATLLSMGRETFERVVADPNALTDMDLDEDSAFYEGYQYIVTAVYKKMTGELPMRAKSLPDAPSGTRWEEETVAKLYPRLAQKHGFD
jgi:hypothetical protein